ncbi:B12-binding domain-containing radical SAM protein [Desulfatirhabdium butyrativorans]|uniref:B12-binding domain-containing radical SAM protein n=1 Tax=Desulfatirhabdium butyrativorans TaxID=340467 RepID=UPI00040BBFCF|nr:radical SAM protein [Desulfatirhabdium butyrativorans]
MRLTLIAPTPPDVSAFGVRALSAYLQMHGKDVRVIFLPGGVEKFRHQAGFIYTYEKPILEQVIALCRGSALIGVSFMSHYLDRARQLCRALKAAYREIPLVVGGIHPTVKPDECLQFSDIVCVGEGEGALLDLMSSIEKNEDYRHIDNLYVKDGDHIYRNPLRRLIQDLDTLPFYDFGPENHYMYDNVNRRVEPVNQALLKRSFPLEPHVEGSFSDAYQRTRSYKTMTTRGCPHHCTFCAENTLANMYGGQKYLRKRSIDHVIRELLWVKQEMPFVESIFLFDDTFLARSTREIQEFARAYKQAIGLPFHIQASPETVNIDKMDALVDAGLVFVEMGIQSTSRTAKHLYRRDVQTETILAAAAIFHRYIKRIYPPCYHVILDNPWETSRDVIETLQVVLRLPPPFWLKRASLVCFPGTELYTLAKRDGFLATEEDEHRGIYAKHLHMPKGSYVNFLMYLAGFSRFPRRILAFLADERCLKLFERDSMTGFYSLLYKIGEFLILLTKGFRSLIQGDFLRIYRYVIRVTSTMS